MADLQDLDYGISFNIDDSGLSKAAEAEIKIDEGFKTASMSASKVDSNIIKAASSSEKASKGVRDIDDGLKKAASGAEKTRDYMEEIEGSSGKSKSIIGELKNTLIGLGIGFGITDAVRAGTESFAGFQQTMANTKATMGDVTNKEFKEMTNAAIEWGSKTEFSAQQVAEAMFYTASAGFNTKTQLEVLPSILNLASAGQIDLSKSSETLTTAMSSLKLQAKDIPVLTDQMATAAKISLTDINHMSDAITNVAGSATQANMSTADLNAELSILANSGKKGADGGVALRNIILDLTAPNDKVSKLMQELGVHITDTTGKIRPFNNILMDLKDKMKGFNQGTQMGILETIGGKENVEALNILLSGSGKQFELYKKQILDSKNAAAAMAKTQNDTLSGSFKILKNSINAAFISDANKSPLGSTLKDLMKTLASMVPKAANEINYFLKQAKQVYTYIASNWKTIGPIVLGIVGALGSLKIMLTVVSWATKIKKAFTEGGVAFKLMTNPVLLAIAAISALIGVLIYAYSTSAKFRSSVSELVKIMKNMLPIIVGVSSAVGLFAVVTKSSAIAQGILSTATTVWSTVTKVATSSTGALTGALKATWAVMAANPIVLVISIIAGLVAAFITLYKTNASFRDGVKAIWTEIANFFKTIAKDIIGVINFIISGLNKIKIPSWIPGIGGKGINIPSIEFKHAAGTNYAEEKASLVGENGPEIIIPPKGSQIKTANETSGILNGSRRSYLNVNRNNSVKIDSKPSFQIIINESKNPRATAAAVEKVLENKFGKYFDKQMGTVAIQMGLVSIPTE